MHRPHPDVHEAGLAEDCAGCEELAENPFANADQPMMRQFVELAIAKEREIPDSYPQARAVKHVLDALERAGKIAEDPTCWSATSASAGASAAASKAGAKAPAGQGSPTIRT